jgi:phage tail-like protein
MADTPDPAAAANEVVDAAKDAAEEVVDAVKDAAEDLIDAAKEAVQNALGGGGDEGGGDEPPAPPAPPTPASSAAAAPTPSPRGSAASDHADLPDPVGELRFQVSIDNVTIGAFAECSGLGVEYDIMEYQEGGEQSFVHKLRGGLKYPNVVLKRGVTYEDALLQWFYDRTDRTKRGAVTLNLLGDDGKQVRTWSFDSAFPVKWTGPSFNAKSTSVATESLEIAHRGFVKPGFNKMATIPPSTDT